jgi:putative transposase
MMEIFRDMMNFCIRIGLENNVSTMKKISLLSYHYLKDYQIMSYYKFTTISQTTGRLAQIKHYVRRGNCQGRKYGKR